MATTTRQRYEAKRLSVPHGTREVDVVADRAAHPDDWSLLYSDIVSDTSKYNSPALDCVFDAVDRIRARLLVRVRRRRLARIRDIDPTRHIEDIDSDDEATDDEIAVGPYDFVDEQIVCRDTHTTGTCSLCPILVE
jgi:hypothetical protein